MSVTSQEKGLEKFLRQQLFREREQPLARFVLRHGAKGLRGTEVDIFPITEQLNSDTIGLLRDDIIDRAQNYADGLGSKLQGFTIEAIVEGTKGGPKYVFRLRGDGEDDDGDDDEEAPTEKGLTSQLMRHNEALMRMLVMTTGSSVQHLQRQLEKSGETISELVQAQAEGRKQLELANSEQHERDMQMLLTSGQEDRKAALFKQVEQLIPVIVRKVSGAPLLTNQEQSLLAPLLLGLTHEQVQGIAQNLSPEQQIMLFNVVKEIKATEDKKAASNNGVH